MKQKRYLLLLITTVLLFFMIITSQIAIGADTQNANRMNVVFVMDESGSMIGTDREGFRYDAMDLFMGLATDSGNYMGAVVFDTEIIQKEDISEINGIGAKNELSQRIRSISSIGDTDIGKAIETATQMLKTQGNPNLPSVIILLSDGNTDLGSDAAYQASLASKRNAIEMARQNGYQVYSVCLNVDGTADPAELREISEATGGTSEEVKNAEDLKKVFSQFYNIIYSTKTIPIGDVVIPDSGEAEIYFQIPRIGVEEANIIISTLNSSTTYRLTQPNGIAYTTEEMDAMKISAKTFSVFKLQHPAYGEWKLVVQGVPGDNVKIEMVYNANLSVEANVNGGNLSCPANQDILITAQLYDFKTAVEDDAIYQEYPLHLVLLDTKTGISTDEVMRIENHSGTYSLYVPEDAEYDIYVYCKIDNMLINSTTYHLSASTSVPVWNQNPIKIKRYRLPFFDVEEKIDLGKVSSDRKGMGLTYQIKKSDFQSSAVWVEGENLKIQLKKVGKGGTLYVTAVNSQGESAEVEIVIQVYSLLPVLLVVLLLFILAVTGLLLVRKAKNKPVRGRIMVTLYTEEERLTPKTVQGKKGKMYLWDYWDLKESIGIERKGTYFVAGEENRYIYFISKEGYYTDFSPDEKNKKIILEDNVAVHISSDNEFRKGMEVTYISDNRI